MTSFYSASPFLSRSLSTLIRANWADILPIEGLLLREFIRQSLYHPTSGYFTRSPHVVGQLPSHPLPFKSFYLKNQYDMHVRKVYDSLQVSWLTPSELFFPYYGHSVARFILDRHVPKLRPEEPLEIFEVGAGGGASARSILDFLMTHRSVSYRIIAFAGPAVLWIF